MHCQTFHVDITDNRDLGWHVHLLLPWAERQSGDEESDTPRDPLLQCEVLLSSNTVHTVDSGLGLESWTFDVPLASTLRRGVASHDVRLAHSFLNSLMQSVPLCAVTGVALC